VICSEETWACPWGIASVVAVGIAAAVQPQATTSLSMLTSLFLNAVSWGGNSIFSLWGGNKGRKCQCRTGLVTALAKGRWSRLRGEDHRLAHPLLEMPRYPGDRRCSSPATRELVQNSAGGGADSKRLSQGRGHGSSATLKYAQQHP